MECLGLDPALQGFVLLRGGLELDGTVRVVKQQVLCVQQVLCWAVLSRVCCLISSAFAWCSCSVWDFNIEGGRVLQPKLMRGGACWGPPLCVCRCYG